MWRKGKSFLLHLFALSLLSGCFGGNGGEAVDEFFGNRDPDTGQGASTTPSGISLLILGGNFQAGAPGQTFSDPLRVQVLENGTPVSNSTIVFSIEGQMGGSLSNSSTTTDASGMALTYFTAGTTAGEQTLRASSVAHGLSVDFSLLIVLQTGSSIVVLSGDGQTATVGAAYAQSLQVSVTDSTTSAPTENILVRFQITSGNGRLNGSQNLVETTTDGTGTAAVFMTAGTSAGTDSVRASIVGDPSEQVTFTLTAQVDSGASIDLVMSTLSVSSSTLVADGNTTILVTFTANDTYGNQLPAGGSTIVIATTSGTLIGSVSDQSDGTYTQSLRAPTSLGSGSLTLSATVDGEAAEDTAVVTLRSGNIDLALSTVGVSETSITADGISTAIVTVTLKDSLGNTLSAGGESVVISATLGSLIGSVQDNSNGTYTQILRAPTATGGSTLSATVGGSSLTDTATTTFVAGPADPSTCVVSPSPSVVVPDGTSISIITVRLKDQYSNLLTSSGGTVTMDTTAGTWSGAVVDNGDGTYQRSLIAPVISGTAVVSATIAGSTITDTATVYFTSGSSGPNVNTSQVTVAQSRIPADGSSTVIVSVILKDSSGNNLESEGGEVVISATAGTLLGAVSYIGSGIHTQLLQAPSSATADVVVSAQVDGLSILDTAMLSFYGAMSLSTSTLTAVPSTIRADGSATSLIVLQAKDSNSVTIPVGGETGVTLATTAGTLLASLVDNNNGTYTQSLQSSVTEETATVSASQSSVSFSDTVNVLFYDVNNLAGTTIDCSNIATYKDGPIYVSGGTVTMNSTGDQGDCPEEFTFTSIILEHGSTLTHLATTSTQEYGLELEAEVLSISSDSTINVTSKGYDSHTTWRFRVPDNQDVTGYLPNSSYSGGSHGGEGGYLSNSATYSSNHPYGSLYEPVTLGASGSSNNATNNGQGGGRIKITITTGALENNGTIVVNGGNPGHCNYAGGAGGSIWIITPSLAGSGSISANGGGTGQCVGGGGGRIAIYADTVSEGFSYPTNFIANVLAKGGLGRDMYKSGAAGTIYLKRSGQSYGDLIINNDNINYDERAKTRIPFPEPTNSLTLSAQSLLLGSYFADKYGSVSPYVGYFIDPNTDQNTTLTNTDNQLFQITAATDDQLTISSGDMTEVGTSGDPFKLVLVFDNVEIIGGAIVDGLYSDGGDPKIISLNGDMGSDDTTTAIVSGGPSAGMEFPNANVTYDLSNTTGTIAGPSLTTTMGAVTIADGTMSIENPLSVSSLTIDSANVTVKSEKGTPAISLTGAFTLTNGANLYQADTTTSTEYSLEVSADSLNLCGSCTISADSRGFKGNTSPSGFYGFLNTLILTYLGNTNAVAGGSHGGDGGYHPGHYYNRVYGSPFYPDSSGAGGGYPSWTGYDGGGLIRITTTGTTIIDGTITANGQNVSGNKTAGAGGSVFISASNIGGSGLVSANGGSGSAGSKAIAGGGGRIALYYTSLFGGFSYPSGVLNRLRTYGGVNYNSEPTKNGAAGTIYLKAASQSYGDLIINNNGIIPGSNSYTEILIPDANQSSELTATTLTLGSAFAEDLDPSHNANTEHLLGLWVHPNTAENGTATYTDDTLFRITSQSSDTLTVSGDMTTVSSTGDTYQVVMILDNIEIRGDAKLLVDGPLLIMSGDLASEDTDSLTIDGSLQTTGDGIIEFNGVNNIALTGAGLDTQAINLATLSIGTDTAMTVTGDLTVSGDLNLYDGSSLSVSGVVSVGGDLSSSNGTISIATTGLTPNLDVEGDISLTGGADLVHAQTTTANIYRLYIEADNLLIDSSSSINLNERGYTKNNNNRFRGPNNIDVIGQCGSIAAAASHGGEGGAHPGHCTHYTYGNFKAPIELGSSYGYGNHATRDGGGAVRLAISDTLTLEGSISSNGEPCSSTGYYGSGSAGSIYIITDTITGDGTISANGGEATIGGNCSGGGGGRIAIYYGTASGSFAYPTGMINQLEAVGGINPSASTKNGAAGTIYLKADSQTYGDLLINNKNREMNNNAQTTFRLPSLTFSSSLTATILQTVSAFTNAYSLVDEWAGFFLHPNSNENATDMITDDSLFEITENTSNNLVVETGSDLTAVATVGDTYEVVLYLDNFEVTGKAYFDFTDHAIYALEGDLSSDDTTTFVQDGYINAAIVDVGDATWSETANAGGTIDVQCASNKSSCD